MDVILQSVSQPAAHRLMIYASSPHLQAFPSEQRFCDHAQEIGLNESDFKGPGLVLLQNCQLSPSDLVKHIMSCFLRGYIVRIYWCTCTTADINNFSFHVKRMLMDLEGTDQSAFLSGEGVLKASKKVDMESDSLDLNINYNSEKFMVPNRKIRLQTFPRELAMKLIDEIPELEGAVHDFSHSLYVVKGDGLIRYGIGKGEDMYLVACDREALLKGAVARACLKLEEVLYVKGITLNSHMLVLDVGAAPGAWTEYLSKKVHHVVAIDPGKLDQNVLAGNVTHICKKAQDSMADLVMWTTGRNFDLLVCDMNKHPVEAAEIIVPLLKFLKYGSFLIVTLKFHGRGNFGGEGR
ncbi:hypothetical protein KP509_26G009000 [Ceratopteris richardii]|uniref:Ribosomal RNA methyltransferase FtsJ domain-containing protein n=1 Tax=Ceratopteris richardii TaxID=49495 RepID=A0A8T2RKL6_CERRI|nr:hypothetical protein KP509_26G009000 [Ceratopteris richardii]